MTHRITVKISSVSELLVDFECCEPDDAWCRQNVVGPGEDPPGDPQWCWFTVLASGFAPWGSGGMYIGPPTDLRSGEIEFVREDPGAPDDCFWYYLGFDGGRAAMVSVQ